MTNKQVINIKTESLWEKLKRKCLNQSDYNTLNERMAIATHDCISTKEEIQSNVVAEPNTQYLLLPELLAVPFKAQENPKFTFIDLFAGIDGFRIAIHNL